MAKLIRNYNGKKAYLGLLTPEEIEEANKMQEFLEKEIPALENKLNEKHKKKTVAYAHEFGTELRRFVEKFEIKGIQEKIFWDQIRDFASSDKNRPKDRSDNRKIYDYYYKLSYYNLKDIENINWGEWSQLFDTPSVIKEERIINWLAIKCINNKIPRDTFRLLMTGIRVFIKGKDTVVFSDEELFNRYDMIYDITIQYFNLYESYFTKQEAQPTEARRKQKKKYQEKYFNRVYQCRKKHKDYSIEEISEIIFKEIYLLNN